jgi:hypothetical protein
MISTGARSLHKLKANRSSDESQASKRASKSSAALGCRAHPQNIYVYTPHRQNKTSNQLRVGGFLAWHPALFSAPKLMHPFAIFEAAPSCADKRMRHVFSIIPHMVSLFCKRHAGTAKIGEFRTPNYSISICIISSLLRVIDILGISQQFHFFQFIHKLGIKKHPSRSIFLST